MNDSGFELIDTIPARCTLGEGPVWDGRIGTLWFTDIQRSQLLRLDWETRDLARFEVPERLASFGLTSDPGRLVCAFASGFATYRPQTGYCHWLYRTEAEYRGIRMNDGRIDRQGRFWAGSMVETESKAPPERGAVYRLDRADGSPPLRMFDGVSISNAICFSPDGGRMYFADTPSQEIVGFALADDGSLAGRQPFARLSGGAYPDGADTDADGRVWNAEWGSGRVTAYDPDGTIFARIELPVSQATSVAFGGPDLDLLFVTTAREGLGEAALESEPLAGDILIYRPGVHGLAAPILRGNDD